MQRASGAAPADTSAVFVPDPAVVKNYANSGELVWFKTPTFGVWPSIKLSYTAMTTYPSKFFAEYFEDLTKDDGALRMALWVLETASAPQPPVPRPTQAPFD